MKKSFLRDIEYERDMVKLLTTLLNVDGPGNSDPDIVNLLRLENRELKDR